MDWQRERNNPRLDRFTFLERGEGLRRQTVMRNHRSKVQNGDSGIIELDSDTNGRDCKEMWIDKVFEDEATRIIGLEI